MNVAVIADIVGSRKLEDRASAQLRFDETIERVERDLPLATRPLSPTVGDEQQGVYPTLDAALAATLLIRLALPAGLDLRFGLGIGQMGEIRSGERRLAEGPGWWAARAAIDQVHALAQRRAPLARTWVAASEDLADRPEIAIARTNAYLLARDEIVGAMNERARHLTYGRCLGQTQSALAEAEGVTQSAVSQALRSGGGSAIVEGFRLLRLS